MVISVKSLLAESFAENIIPGIILPKSIRVEEDDVTAVEVWECYVHHLNWAYEGKHAPTDYRGRDWPRGSPQEALAGKDLCGGIRLVFF